MLPTHQEIYQVVHAVVSTHTPFPVHIDNDGVKFTSEKDLLDKYVAYSLIAVAFMTAISLFIYAIIARLTWWLAHSTKNLFIATNNMAEKTAELAFETRKATEQASAETKEKIEREHRGAKRIIRVYLNEILLIIQCNLMSKDIRIIGDHEVNIDKLSKILNDVEISTRLEDNEYDVIFKVVKNARFFFENMESESQKTFEKMIYANEDEKREKRQDGRLDIMAKMTGLLTALSVAIEIFGDAEMKQAYQETMLKAIHAQNMNLIDITIQER